MRPLNCGFDRGWWLYANSAEIGWPLIRSIPFSDGLTDTRILWEWPIGV